MSAESSLETYPVLFKRMADEVRDAGKDSPLAAVMRQKLQSLWNGMSSEQRERFMAPSVFDPSSPVNPDFYRTTKFRRCSYCLRKTPIRKWFGGGNKKRCPYCGETMKEADK